MSAELSETPTPVAEGQRSTRWISVAAIPTVLLVWQLVAWTHLLPPDVLPGPAAIGTQLVNMLGPRANPPYALERDALATLGRLLAGTGLAFLVSIPLGVGIGGSRWFRAVAQPFLSMGLAIPALAMVPLYMLVFGIGDTTDLAVVFVEALIPLTVTISIGYRSIPAVYLWSSRSLGSSWLHATRRVTVPALTASLVGGLRQGMGYAWRSLIAVEGITALQFGVGYRAFQAGEFFDTQTIFAEIAVVAVIGILLEVVLFGYVERITVQKWGMVHGHR